MTAQSTHRGSLSSTASMGGFTAARIREVDFVEARRGYDKAAVHAYLDAVADEVEALHRALITARNESERYKNALRQWQATQAGTPPDVPAAPQGAPTPSRAEHTRPSRPYVAIAAIAQDAGRPNRPAHGDNTR